MGSALPAVLAAASVAFVAVALLSRWHGRGAALDAPGHRSLHQTPTPRLGGLGIALGVVAGLIWLKFHDAHPSFLFYLAIPLFALSLWEDFRPLSALPRLAVHALTALALVISYGGVHFSILPGLSVALGWAAGVLTVLAVVWMTNLYNFMDGMDGLAGCMGLIGFGALGLACARSGAGDLAAQAWILAAACAGFLPWNLPRARIFMGDGGAIPLGFLAAGFALEAAARGVLPLWFAALVFSPFWVDATLTLGRRLRRGERVWEAHREHHYQRWVLKGGRHGPVLLVEAGLMLACGVSGIIMLDIPSAAMQWTGLTAWGVVYAVLVWVGPSSSAR